MNIDINVQDWGEEEVEEQYPASHTKWWREWEVRTVGDQGTKE